MLNTDKYTEKLQKIGFEKEQAKLVVDKMLSFANLVVNNYLLDKSVSEAKNRSENVAQVEQKQLQKQNFVFNKL